MDTARNRHALGSVDAGDGGGVDEAASPRPVALVHDARPNPCKILDLPWKRMQLAVELDMA